MGRRLAALPFILAPGSRCLPAQARCWSPARSSGARDRLAELRCRAIAGSRGGREVRRHASRYGAIDYSRELGMSAVIGRRHDVGKKCFRFDAARALVRE
jgi:hypothetical protein